MTNLDGDGGDANDGQLGEKINHRALDSKVSVANVAIEVRHGMPARLIVEEVTHG